MSKKFELVCLLVGGVTGVATMIAKGKFEILAIAFAFAIGAAAAKMIIILIQELLDE